MSQTQRNSFAILNQPTTPKNKNQNDSDTEDELQQSAKKQQREENMQREENLLKEKAEKIKNTSKTKQKKKRKANENVSDIEEQNQLQTQREIQSKAVNDVNRFQTKEEALLFACDCLNKALAFDNDFATKQKIQIEISNIQNIHFKTNNIIEQSNIFEQNDQATQDKNVQQQISNLNKRFDKFESTLQKINTSSTESNKNAASTWAKIATNANKSTAFDFSTKNAKSSAVNFSNKKSTTSTSTSSFKSTTQISYRDRRLILSDSKESSFDALNLRRQLNEEFKLKLQTEKPVIAAITKSQKNENVVLTTTESFSADYLSKNQSVWAKFFVFSSTYKDKEWHKIIVHGIPTESFNFDNGIQLLKEEIECFNEIKPIAVNWLSSKENRDSKFHASAVLSFDSKELVTKLLTKRLMIAGLPLRTQAFEERKKKDQCQKCQKFEHESRTCKNEMSCQFCAEKHLTRLHRCAICSTIGQTCAHTVLKCSNCNKNHRANNKECEVFQNLNEKSIEKSNEKPISSSDLIDVSSDAESTSTQISKW